MEYTKEELELRETFDEYKKRYGIKALIDNRSKEILSLNNPALSAYFALLPGEDAIEHAKIVRASGNLEAILEITKRYPKLLRYIIESKDFDYNFRAVKQLFEGAKSVHSTEWGLIVNTEKRRQRIKDHVNVITECSDIDNLISFFEWYCEAIKEKDIYHSFSRSGYNYYGLDLLEKLDQEINKIITKIAKSDDAKKMYYAYTLQESLIRFLDWHYAYEENTELKESIIKTGDAECCYFILDKYNSTDEELENKYDIIISSKDPVINYLCIKNPYKANIADHLKAIAESGDLEFNYLACLLGAGDDTLNRKVVIESGDAKCNFELALKFPDDPLYDEYVKVVEASGNKEYIDRLPELRSYMNASINEKIKKIKAMGKKSN